MMDLIRMNVNDHNSYLSYHIDTVIKFLASWEYEKLLIEKRIKRESDRLSIAINRLSLVDKNNLRAVKDATDEVNAATKTLNRLQERLKVLNLKIPKGFAEIHTYENQIMKNVCTIE